MFSVSARQPWPCIWQRVSGSLVLRRRLMRWRSPRLLDLSARQTEEFTHQLPCRYISAILSRLPADCGGAGRCRARQRAPQPPQPIPCYTQRWNNVVISTHGFHSVILWFPRRFSIHPSVVFFSKPEDGLVIGRRPQWQRPRSPRKLSSPRMI